MTEDNKGYLEKVYRYEGIKYSWGVDPYDNPLPGYRLEVVLKEYSILKRTPKGFWIGYAFGGGGKFKFILANAKKKYAHKTKEAAAESFIARKERQIAILKDQLKCAERELEIFNHQQKRNAMNEQESNPIRQRHQDQVEFEKEKAKILEGLPDEFQTFLSAKAWEEGHSCGYHEVLNILKDLVWNFQIAFTAYEIRMKQKHEQELDRLRATIRDQGVLLEGGI